MGILSFLGGLFSSSKVADTAIDAVRKFGGLNGMDDKEKASFLLSYIRETKHQSIARRAIALTLTALFSLMVMMWLISAGVGYWMGHDGAITYSVEIKVFMSEVLTNPYSLVISFYFIVNIAQKMGK